MIKKRTCSADRRRMKIRTWLRVVVFCASIFALLVCCGCAGGQEEAIRALEQLKDSRDGKTYKAMRVGGHTWMAENLNHQTVNSWCYEDNFANCTANGRLYNWDAAVAVCPSGWHLPSRAEWSNFAQATGGGKRAASREAVPDTASSSEQSVPLGGYRNSGGYFYNSGESGYWWSSTEYESAFAYGRYTYPGNKKTYEYNGYQKSDGFSVRCVQDRDSAKTTRSGGIAKLTGGKLPDVLKGKTARYVQDVNKPTASSKSAATPTVGDTKRYTVSFNTDGGTPSQISTVFVDAGKSLGSSYPTNPRKVGHTFDGWFDRTTGWQYTAWKPINKDLTLTAKWSVVRGGGSSGR